MSRLRPSTARIARSTHNTNDCWYKTGSGKGIRSLNTDDNTQHQPQPQQPSSSSSTTPVTKNSIFNRQTVGEGDYRHGTYFEMMVSDQTTLTKTVNKLQFDSKTDRLLTDSGTQVCVCPHGYAPECPILPLTRELAPDLRTATGDYIAICGEVRGLQAQR